MTTYAIGDIQGCYQPLMCLLEQVGFNPETDSLWVAGDLVNRGPQSLETLRFLRSLGERARVILGNHDLHMLAVAEGIKKATPSDTLEAVFNAPDRDELLNWVRHQPLLHYDPMLNYLMVHAGIPPQWSVSKAISLSREVEQALQGPDYLDFLRGMYGDQPDCWDDRLSGIPRLRLITNYLTRMRLCSAKGQLDLKHKLKPSSEMLDQGFMPWFRHPHRLSHDQPIIFGHWAALEGKSDHDHVFALDTGCIWGGRLTLMCLEDQQLYSCDCSSGDSP